MELEQLQNQLGFILTTINEASDEERDAIENQYKDEVELILQQISEIENNG